MSVEQNPQYQPFDAHLFGTDLTQTHQSDTTRSRKKYPREHHGAKNEWHALIQHQADVNNQIIQIEKDLKNLRAQDLDQAYKQKFQQQIQAKEQELQQKRSEEELMNMRIAQHQQDLAKQKQDKHALQNLLADSYENLIDHHANQSTEEKQRKLQHEKLMLEGNQRKIESEQRRRLQAKQEFTNIAYDQIDKFYDKKYAEKQDFARSRDEYNQLVSQNIQRDLVKEENYRNSAAQQQRQLEELHTQNVLSDQLHRQQRIQDTIENRVHEANQRSLDKERMQMQRKEDTKNDLKSTLLNQMDFKADQANSLRTLKTFEAQDSVRKLQGHQQYLQDVKSQQIYGKQLYKDILDKQHQEWQERQKANRMTKHEKKLNNMDLQAYKQSDYQLHSLIPGLQHSKYDFNGSPALKKIAKSTLQSSNRTLLNINSDNFPKLSSDMGYQTNTKVESGETLGSPKEPTGTLRNNNFAGDGLSTPKNQLIFSPNARNIIASPTYITSTNNALSNQINTKYLNQSPSALLSGKKTQDPIRENIFYRPPPQNSFSIAKSSQFDGSNQTKQARLPPSNQAANLNSPKTSSLMIDPNISSHNPITNPMPFQTQNPYILKQLRSIPRSTSNRNSYIGNVSGNYLIS